MGAEPAEMEGSLDINILQLCVENLSVISAGMPY